VYDIWLYTYRKLEYTRETLIKFKKEFDEKQKAAAKGSSSGGFGGFGGFGGDTKVTLEVYMLQLCLSQASTWISNIIFNSFFDVLWVEMRFD